MPELIVPHPRFRESFLAAMAEFADEGRSGDGTMVGSDLAEFGATWDTPDGFGAYVAEVLSEAVSPRFDGWVPCTTLWWVDGSEYVGRIAIRHALTGRLREFGGHIGYDVRRSRRRQGHATAMLAAALPIAHGLGIDPALVTCDSDNVGSIRVIEGNGGTLEDVRGVKRRYWVPTN